MIPALLSAMAAATLFIALYAFWQSLRAAFDAGEGAELFVALPSDARRIAQQERLDAVLRTLKDIELERDTGKIAENDYARLEARLRAQAKALLMERDAGLGPYLEAARARVDAYLDAAGLRAGGAAERDDARAPGASAARAGASAASAPAAAPAPEAEAPAAVGRAAPAAAPSDAVTSGAVPSGAVSDAVPSEAATAAARCGACGTGNDADARFCKACGRPISDDAAAAEVAS